MLKHRDREGRRIYLCKLGKSSLSRKLKHRSDIIVEATNTRLLRIPADYIKAPDMYQVSKLDDIWFEAVLNEPQTYRKGVAVLMDVKGYDYQYIYPHFRWFHEIIN